MKINWYIKHFNELTIRKLLEIIALLEEVFVFEINCIYQDADDQTLVSNHKPSIAKDGILYINVL